jgi:hypothetical protein
MRSGRKLRLAGFFVVLLFSDIWLILTVINAVDNALSPNGREQGALLWWAIGGVVLLLGVAVWATVRVGDRLRLDWRGRR